MEKQAQNLENKNTLVGFINPLEYALPTTLKLKEPVFPPLNIVKKKKKKVEMFTRMTGEKCSRSSW